MNSSGPHSTVSKDAEKFSINVGVIIFGHYIIFGHAELYGRFGFKFTYITVASGLLCFVMSLCMPYVCIVSLCVFTCISTCALGILKTCLN